MEASSWETLTERETGSSQHPCSMFSPSMPPELVRISEYTAPHLLAHPRGVLLGNSSWVVIWSQQLRIKGYGEVELPGRMDGQLCLPDAILQHQGREDSGHSLTWGPQRGLNL